MVGIDNQYFCCYSSCGIEVVSWGDLLLVGDNTTLVARAYDWREWDRGSPIVTLSPNDRGACGHVCISPASVERGILVHIASSFWDHASRHVGRIDGLLYVMRRLMRENNIANGPAQYHLCW